MLVGSLYQLINNVWHISTRQGISFFRRRSVRAPPACRSSLWVTSTGTGLPRYFVWRLIPQILGYISGSSYGQSRWGTNMHSMYARYKGRETGINPTPFCSLMPVSEFLDSALGSLVKKAG
jgi:hypothetical protein